MSAGVTWASQLPASAPATVNAGRTSLTAIEIEQPASMRAHFKTSTGASTQWSRMTVGHAKLPAGFLYFPNSTATTRVPSIDATNLYPHHDGYGVYAGTCELNNPAYWNPDYFQPGGPGYIELDPGDNLKSVDVRMPTLTMRVTKTSTRQARVTVTQMDGPSCVDKLADITVAGTPPATAVDIPISLPFGRYRVCVDDGVNRKTSASFTANTSTPQDANLTPGQSLSQTDPMNMNNTTGRVTGTCPS